MGHWWYNYRAGHGKFAAFTCARGTLLSRTRVDPLTRVPGRVYYLDGSCGKLGCQVRDGGALVKFVDAVVLILTWDELGSAVLNIAYSCKNIVLDNTEPTLGWYGRADMLQLPLVIAINAKTVIANDCIIH